MFLMLFFAVPLCAAIAGESRFPSLSQNAGIQGNPAALSAYGSPGAIFGYEKYEKYGYEQLDNFIFGFWGTYHGAYFDWTNGKNGYDRSEWSYLFSEFNASRSFFLGNRFSIARTSHQNGTAFSWTPGLILRPSSFISFGFWSEQALQYGFYQNRMQNIGFSVRPFNGITASWNAGIKNYEQLRYFYSKVDKNLLIELEALGFTFGIEFPVPNSSEFQLSLSTTFGSYFNTSAAFELDSLNSNSMNFKKFNNSMNFKKFNLTMHSALNKESLSDVNMVRIPLGSISEKSEGWSLFGGYDYDLETLRNTFALLEKSKTKAVLFDFSNYSGGFSISQEIRRGIYSLRSKGKRIAAYTDDFSASVIFAASAAEKVILQPSAFVDFKGFSNDISYYKGLLDFAGVKVEMLRHGKYKSAVEPYTLDSMSIEARENLQGILDDWWKITRDTIANSRWLSQNFLDSITNNPKVTASAAKRNGIADTLLYLEEIPKYMYKAFWGKENENAYFIDWYLNNEKIIQNSWAPRPKIAVLNIDGVIVGGYGSSDPMFGKNVSGALDLIDNINEIAYSGEYKALILRINSPGGSAIASDELWRAIVELKNSGIPVIASVSDMAASGAYYAACASDKIVAEAGSIVGSIGIYGGKVDLSGLLTKLKIKTETLKTHENADSRSIMSGFSESSREALQEYMDEFYSRFVGVVAEGRGISEEKADSLGDGRVFLGITAKENGLIDEIGGFGRAVEIARESANLGKNANIELVHINNSGYSFMGKVYAMAKGDRQIYPWLNLVEKTQVWAIFLR